MFTVDFWISFYKKGEKMNRRFFLKSSALFLSSLAFYKTAFAENKNIQNVAVLAATGKAGRLIMDEALSRGLKVTAFVRNSKKLEKRENLNIVEKDIFKLTADDLKNFDAIFDAFGEWKNLELHKKHAEHLVAILQNNPAKIYIVGGAGSLYTDKTHTKRLMDSPDFPSAHLPLVAAVAEGLDVFRASQNVNWVYVSPPKEFIFEGEKTGKYKIIGEEFETNDKGQSVASYKDYAAAMVDLAVQNKLNRVRVGVIGL